MDGWTEVSGPNSRYLSNGARPSLTRQIPNSGELVAWRRTCTLTFRSTPMTGSAESPHDLGISVASPLAQARTVIQPAPCDRLPSRAPLNNLRSAQEAIT